MNERIHEENKIAGNRIEVRKDNMIHSFKNPRRQVMNSVNKRLQYNDFVAKNKEEEHGGITCIG